ncbi:hypothetical protein J437_LFUL011240, partial [Ladona fulva]
TYICKEKRKKGKVGVIAKQKVKPVEKALHTHTRKNTVDPEKFTTGEQYTAMGKSKTFRLLHSIMEHDRDSDFGTKDINIEVSGSESSILEDSDSESGDGPETIQVGESSMSFEEISDVVPLKFFELFFDDDVIGFIANETNQMTTKSFHYKPSGSSAEKDKQWREVSGSKICVFLELVMLQSIIQKPDLKFYWSTRPILWTDNVYLHFCHNEEYDPKMHPIPKLNKIWPVYQKLEEKCKMLYTPERDITIDESLLLYKGRLGWKQFIPQKRPRFGIKTFNLSESRSGYVWFTIIYTVKGTLFDDESKDKPMSSQVVMTLMKPLLDKGYCLITLISHSSDTYGTLRRTRRGILKELETKKLKRGEVAAFRKGKVMVLRWKDKKEVTLLSTGHTNEMKTVEKMGKFLVKPAGIDYNHTMGGVDQHLFDYPLPRKRSKKYYKKIFHLVELIKCGGRKVHLDYRLLLIEQLIEVYHPTLLSPRSGRPPAAQQLWWLIDRHFPDSLPPTEKKTAPT